MFDLFEDFVVCCIDGCGCFFIDLIFNSWLVVDLYFGIFIGFVDVF